MCMCMCIVLRPNTQPNNLIHTAVFRDPIPHMHPHPHLTLTPEPTINSSENIFGRRRVLLREDEGEGDGEGESEGEGEG